MKVLSIVSLSFFLLSIIFRLLHWPGASLMIIISVLLLFIFTAVNSFRKKTVFNINILGGWTLFVWSVYILFRYLYWYSGPSILGFNTLFLLAAILSIIYIFFILKNKEKKLSTIILSMTIFGFVLSYVPSYNICYLFDLNEIINKDNNETNYYSWDKYSWFLYISGHKDKALDANEKSIEAWHRNNEIYQIPNNQDTISLTILKNHRQGILNENWTDSYIRYQFR